MRRCTRPRLHAVDRRRRATLVSASGKGPGHASPWVVMHLRTVRRGRGKRPTRVVRCWEMARRNSPTTVERTAVARAHAAIELGCQGTSMFIQKLQKIIWCYSLRVRRLHVSEASLTMTAWLRRWLNTSWRMFMRKSSAIFWSEASAIIAGIVRLTEECLRSKIVRG